MAAGNILAALPQTFFKESHKSIPFHTVACALSKHNKALVASFVIIVEILYVSFIEFETTFFYFFVCLCWVLLK